MVSWRVSRMGRVIGAGVCRGWLIGWLIGAVLGGIWTRRSRGLCVARRADILREGEGSIVGPRGSVDDTLCRV